MVKMEDDIEKVIPRGMEYKNKDIKEQNYIVIRGTCYFKRLFTDESVELVRYDCQAKMWVVLYFQA